MAFIGEGNSLWRFKPANQPKRSYAKRIPEANWTKFEPLIRRWHAELPTPTREEILRRLNERGFKPSLNQLDWKLKPWGLTELRPRHNSSFSQNIIRDFGNIQISPEDFPIPGAVQPRLPWPLSPSSRDAMSASSQSGSASETDDSSLGTTPSPSSSPHSVFQLGHGNPTVFQLTTEYKLEGFAYSKLTRFWESWDYGNLVGKAPVVADFFCASHMFKEAFDVNYCLLSALIRDTTGSDELLANTIIACLRTASTPEQYGKAIAITTLTTKEPTIPSDFLDWFAICLNLHEHDLIRAYGKQWPVLRTLPPELEGLGDVLFLLKSAIKRRECFLFAIRARQTDCLGELLTQVRLPVSDLYIALTIASSQSERHERYRCRGTGQRLLQWCAAMLTEDIGRLGSNLSEFSQPFQGGVAGHGGQPSNHLQHFLSDSLFRYLLRIWPRRPPFANNIDLESSPLPESTMEARSIWFDLFEALAAFSPLVMAEALADNLQSRSLVEAAPHVLQTINLILDDGYDFHKKFLDAYWVRISTHASNICRNFRSIQLTQASLEFASSLDARPISNFHLCDTGIDLWPSSVPSKQLSVPELTADELLPQPFDDPMLWQRWSDSSSVYSHLSAIKRGSSSSSESKSKRQSSAAMSVDSWKILDTGSIRESTRDNDFVMTDT